MSRISIFDECLAKTQDPLTRVLLEYGKKVIIRKESILWNDYSSIQAETEARTVLNEFDSDLDHFYTSTAKGKTDAAPEGLL